MPGMQSHCKTSVADPSQGFPSIEGDGAVQFLSLVFWNGALAEHNGQQE